MAPSPVAVVMICGSLVTSFSPVVNVSLRPQVASLWDLRRLTKLRGEPEVKDKSRESWSMEEHTARLARAQAAVDAAKEDKYAKARDTLDKVERLKKQKNLSKLKGAMRTKLTNK